MPKAIMGPQPLHQSFEEWLNSLNAGYIKTRLGNGHEKAIPVEAIRLVYEAYQEGATVYPSGNFNHENAVSLIRKGY